MFHANAWGLPFTCTLVGATQVLPGPHLDAASLLDAFQREHVTFTAGVPTIWLGILQALDTAPQAYDLSSLRAMAVGGSAAPPSMIEGFQERHGLKILHAWGMTETTPLGSIANLPSALEHAAVDEQSSFRAKQGIPVPFVEIRAQGPDGPVPWDGGAMGELEVRGPWVAGAYYNTADATDRWTGDGWFRTGDIVTLDPRGTIHLQDRAKDVIKSGGEWINSIALENALMGHRAVAEAAVIGVPHAKWLERPLAVVVLKGGQAATAAELLAYLRPQFAKWWLPDVVTFVDAIPHSGVGKVLKSALRQQFRDVTGEATAEGMLATTSADEGYGPHNQ
jgi:fatty-acyl-CoA synthase